MTSGLDLYYEPSLIFTGEGEKSSPTDRVCVSKSMRHSYTVRIALAFT